MLLLSGFLNLDISGRPCFNGMFPAGKTLILIARTQQKLMSDMYHCVTIKDCTCQSSGINLKSDRSPT